MKNKVVRKFLQTFMNKSSLHIHCWKNMGKGKLFFIGLGLYDEQDLSIKAQRTIKKADYVFVEFYTSFLAGSSMEKLRASCGKDFIVLNRQETEEASILLSKAKEHIVAFLVGGDSLTATTHIDLRIRAIKQGIHTSVIHGSSVLTAVPGLLGLQHYKFGRITTLVNPEKNYFPMSPYDMIKENKKQGLHSLVLLDIQADKNYFMTANEGIKLLLKMEGKKNEKVFSNQDIICVVARAGSTEPLVKADTIEQLEQQQFGPPLHTLVVPGNLHFMEVEALKYLADLPEQVAKKLQKV
jgi:diphthine synthase